MEVIEAEPEAPEPRPGPIVKVAQDLSLPQEPAPGPSPEVHSAPVPVLELHNAPPIMSPAPAPAPDGKPAGGVDYHPGSPPELAPRPLADVDPAPAATPQLHRTPAIPSLAPLLAPDEQLAGGLDSYPQPPPELAPVSPGEVDPAPPPTPELHKAPAIPSPPPSLAPDAKPAGASDSYPGPPPEPAPRPQADVDPAPIPTPELDVAQVLLQLYHQCQMVRWIPILDYLQNQSLDHQLMSILLLLQHRSSTEHQLFHDQLQRLHQMKSQLEGQILIQGYTQNWLLDRQLMSILLLLLLLLLHQHWSSV
ncbi:uncharacterized protein PS065_020220 [Dugong dugon]